ncbi:MAG: DoxX family membrane protein [Sphingomonadales bacterium]|nr:DoxX family membrane protein [Sphingomonadales bacterium]
MAAPLRRYDAAVAWLSGRIPESLALLLVRVALGGVFWRSGQTKVESGTWFTLTDATRELFRSEYAGVPLPAALAAPLANAAEHVLPALLLAGLFTRASALGLLGMTMTIQIFVYPDAWWPEHSLWAALALVLAVRGGGLISADAAFVARTRG